MNKLLLVVGAVFLGPPILRALAGRPDLLKSGADLLERTGATAVDLGRRGAARIAKEIEARRGARASVSGLFGASDATRRTCAMALSGLARTPDLRAALARLDLKCLS